MQSRSIKFSVNLLYYASLIISTICVLFIVMLVAIRWYIDANSKRFIETTWPAEVRYGQIQLQMSLNAPSIVLRNVVIASTGDSVNNKFIVRIPYIRIVVDIPKSIAEKKLHIQRLRVDGTEIVIKALLLQKKSGQRPIQIFQNVLESEKVASALSDLAITNTSVKIFDLPAVQIANLLIQTDEQGVLKSTIQGHLHGQQIKWDGSAQIDKFGTAAINLKLQLDNYQPQQDGKTQLSSNIVVAATGDLAAETLQFRVQANTTRLQTPTLMAAFSSVINGVYKNNALYIAMSPQRVRINDTVVAIAAISAYADAAAYAVMIPKISLVDIGMLCPHICGLVTDADLSALTISAGHVVDAILVWDRQRQCAHGHATIANVSMQYKTVKLEHITSRIELKNNLATIAYPMQQWSFIDTRLYTKPMYLSNGNGAFTIDLDTLLPDRNTDPFLLVQGSGYLENEHKNIYIAVDFLGLANGIHQTYFKTCHPQLSITQTHNLIPYLVINTTAGDWMQASLTKGNFAGCFMLQYGKYGKNLRSFIFDGDWRVQQGLVTTKFMRPLTVKSAEVSLRPNGVFIEQGNASYANAAAQIEQFSFLYNGQMTAHATTKAPLSHLLDIANEFSAKKLPRLTQTAGNIDTQLDLTLDINAPEHAKFTVDSKLDGVAAALIGNAVTFSNATGTIHIDTHGVTTTTPISLDIAGNAIVVSNVVQQSARDARNTLHIEGTFSPALFSTFNLDLVNNIITGTSRFTADIQHTAGEFSSALLQTDLQGSELLFPNDWGKSPQSTLATFISIAKQPDAKYAVTLAAEHHIRVLGVFPQQLFDGDFTSENQQADIDISVSSLLLPELIQWSNTNFPGALLNTANTPEQALRAATNVFSTIAIDVGVLDIGSLVFNDISLLHHYHAERFNASIASPDVNADLTWDFATTHDLRIDFKKLHLNFAETAADASITTPDTDPLASFNPSILPTTKINIDRLFINGADFGELQLASQPTADGFVVKSLKMHKDMVYLYADGYWLSNGRQTASGFDMHMHGSDIANFAGVISAKSGVLSANISWPGSPINLQPGNVEGSVNLQFADGSVHEKLFDNPLFKLLGFLNLEFLALNFKLDLIEKNQTLPFTQIKSEFDISGGYLTSTSPYFFNGPTLKVLGQGITDIVNQTLDHDIILTVSIRKSLPLVTVLAGAAPITVLSVLLLSLFQNSPLDAFTSAEYTIAGPYTDPNIKLKAAFRTSFSEKK